MKIENRMLQTVLNHQAYYLEDFMKVKAAVSQSKAIYKGAPVPYLYIPKVYTPEDVKTFEYALSGMMEICKKAIELYEHHAEIRDLFAFSKELEELILLPHYYPCTVPMGRFDIFYYGPGAFKFCELNADGASAMNEEKELSAIIATNEIVKAYSEDYHFTPFELFDSWVDEVGKLYDAYLSNRKLPNMKNHKPVVAILDFIDKSSSIEFEVFKEAFNSKGYRAIIVDPRDIELVNGRMTIDGLVIDIVYRRLVTKDLMDRYAEIPDFIEGLKAQETCVIGPIKTQIIHTKRFFELLYHPKMQHYFSQNQLEFIKAHVPLTMPLKDLGESNEFVVNKDAYIIKPVDYYASKGVSTGVDYSQDQWRNLLLEKIKEDFIIQAYCPLAITENIVYNKGALVKKSFRTITGLFVYNGRFSGVYVRAGLNAIISGLHDGYTMSTLVANRK